MFHVILPAYNEGRGIRELVESIHQFCKDEDYRIIVVNDGSRDNTAQVVEELVEHHPITLVNHPTNQGPGAAFRTGLTVACREADVDDIAITLEADSTNDPALLLEMVRLIDEGYDIVTASRYKDGGGYEGFPLYRHLLSLSANTLYRLLFPLSGLRDYSIFYRAYRIGLLRRAFETYGTDFISRSGFEANTEIILKLRKFQPRASEVPLQYRYYLKKGRSSMRIIKTLRGFVSLAAEATSRRWGRR